MRKFHGMCVGGGRAGQSIDSQTPSFKYHLMRDVPALIEDYNPSEDIVADIEMYHHEKFETPQGCISFWRHESVETPYDLMVILADSYEKSQLKDQ